MPIRRDVWYSVDVDGQTRFRLPTIYRLGRDTAVDAAEDYHANHDGWESRWPLEFTLYESEDGPAVARFEVELDMVPSFFVTEKPLSAVAPQGER